MQGIRFAQTHLFHRDDGKIQVRTGKCDLNNFLFGKLTRAIGYIGLDGKTEDSEIFMQSHVDHGTIPTITVSDAEEILNPNPAIARMIKLANEL